MFDYECYTDSIHLDEEYDDHDWKLNYGTSDPNVPVSQVPCGGCGALLHCQVILWPIVSYKIYSLSFY